MEDIKRCKKCGTRLLEHETRCPVCGLKVNQNEDEIINKCIDDLEENDDLIDNQRTESDEPEKSYWFNKKIWLVFAVLVVVTTLMKQYVYNNQIRVSNDIQSAETNEKYDLTVDQKTSDYSLQTNINYLGISYVSEDAVYITMNNEILKYDLRLHDRELFLDEYATAFSEDQQYYYYLDENNQYLRVNKKDDKQDVLLVNVYYVHKLGNKIYYQDDTDGETIHCLDLKEDKNTKINNEVSYSMIVDETKERIFYLNKSHSLISIALDGSDEKQLASNTDIYTYDGEYLYYIDIDNGLYKCDLDGKAELIYESANLRLVNVIDDKLIVQDNNVIYITDLDGQNRKKLYTMDFGGSLTFEVVGDKVLVLAKGSNDASVSYEIIGLDGKRHLLDSDDQPRIKGNEF